MRQIELFFWRALFMAGVLIMANADFLSGVFAR
jgi:hypothetical protein